jgi:hypothetical protein
MVENLEVARRLRRGIETFERVAHRRRVEPPALRGPQR